MSFAANAYARTARSALSPREAEAAVLIKAAQQLQVFAGDWASDTAGLNKALNFNQKVWTILATAATETDNPLPNELKQNIANLSIFVFRCVIDTMIQPNAEKLAALISINHNLAAGLQGR